MHLDVIQSISLAGDSAKANDDRAGAGHAHAWIIDGATDLGEPGLLGGRGGAAWIAAEADRAFAIAAADHEAYLDVVCDAVFAAVAARFETQRTRDPEPWELPSASLFALRAVDNYLDCAWLGDCAALLIRDGVPLSVGAPIIDGHDDEVALARSVAQHGLGSPKRVAPVLEALRAARANPRREVLSVAPSRDAFYTSQPCVAGDELLLMTDGFAALIDTYRLVALADLHALLVAEGLHGLAARVRAAEAEDADCVRWPRFKRGDDATALWLRIAA